MLKMNRQLTSICSSENKGSTHCPRQCPTSPPPSPLCPQPHVRFWKFPGEWAVPSGALGAEASSMNHTWKPRTNLREDHV